MGDTNTNAAADNVEQQSEQTGKASIDLLRETKPAQDISIKDSNVKQIEQEGDTQTDTCPVQKPTGPAKIETVFEKLDMSSDKSDSTTDSAVAESTSTDKPVVKAKPSIDIPPLDFEIRDNTPLYKNDKHASDIFSLKEIDNTKQKNVNSIWSISGAPSGRINRKKDQTSSVFPAGCMGCKDEPPSEVSPRRFIDAKEAQQDCVGHIDNTPRKRPTSSKPRNPLTGAGIDDDVKKTSARRKDGNPVLGVGYDDKPPASTSSSSRIPPGGFSQGLW